MENVVYGYITPETLAGLGEPQVLDRLYVLANEDRFDRTHVRRVANDVKAFLEARGHVVRRIDVPPPGQHPHALIMSVLLLVMAAFGMFALMLSGVIVVNLLLARMAAERRQIGVMKAIGATRSQIARIYLAEATLLGVAAIVLATPVGIVGGRALSQQFAVLLNFDLASMGVPAWVYLLVTLCGLLVPLAAAAYPVWSGTAVTVRAALADNGVNAATFGSTRLDHLLCGLGGAGRPWLLGVRNSVRRRTRTALTLATLSTAGAFFISAFNVRLSMMTTLDRQFGPGTYGADNRYALDQHMLMFYVFLIVVSGVLATVGGFGLMTTTSLNVLDRRRELGILRAIGASPMMVRAIVVIEAVFVAVLGWALAVPAAWPISAVIGSFLTAAMFPRGLAIIFAPAGVVGWLGISTALAVLSSLVPAFSASRHSVRETLTYE
jgi:ABC-type antimicrobial peptide transport system permease subunit